MAEYRFTFNVEPKNHIGGERPAKVYSIGRHDVTVYDDGEVTTSWQYGYQGDPRRTLPNMEILDGEIRIRMEDLIDEILARISPDELAAALWAHAEVKERFMDALAENYTPDNVDDKDRRAFLDKVKEQIHDKALDKLVSAMGKMEYGLSTAWSCYREIRKCNEWLEARDFRDKDGKLYRLNDPSFSGQFSIGGASWNEARDHWRHEIRQHLGWKSETDNA